MTNWKHKLLAYLHDPPTKALDVRNHGEQSAAAMIRAGFSQDEVRDYNKNSDHTAAAADRLPFPNSVTAGLSCTFDGVQNAFKHPLSGTNFPFHAPFASTALGIEGEQSVQPAIGDFGDLSEDLRWRARFFAHWRLWPRHAAEKDYRFALFPADTRMPDHTIWNHMQVVSALAGCAASEDPNSPLQPAFLKFQLGPVQDFIAQARSTRDLWSGSYLLSWLMAAGLKRLSELAGPDSVIFPSLRGQPLFDLQWRDDLWNKIRMAEASKTVWESLGHVPSGLLTPNLPNVFLALVPAPRAQELAKQVEAAIRAEWQSISDHVWKYCDEAGPNGQNLTADEGTHLTRAVRRLRFDAQARKFLSISWQVTPWPDSLPKALALADGFAPDMPISEARARIEAVVQMATNQIPHQHRDGRFYTDDAKTQLNNMGLAWSVIYAFHSWQFDAVRQTRSFSSWSEGGWQTGTANNKDALNGRDEAVAGGREWADRCQRLGGAWPSLFKKSDWLGAITLIKRVWHLAYLKKQWGLDTAKDMPMASTRSVAAHDPCAKDDQLDPESGAEDRYFAILALDGDEIGKWISGEKTPDTGKLLAEYEAEGKAVGSKPYFTQQATSAFLKSPRPLSPSYHLQFSEALANFALRCARPIVEAFDGRLIYSGGDDVLAMLPADTALICARALRAAFRGDLEVSSLLATATRTGKTHFYKEMAAEKLLAARVPGFIEPGEGPSDYSHRPVPLIVPGPEAEVSVGIAIAHFKSPLQDIVREAQQAEKRAKGMPGKAAVAVSLFKRSGEIVHWRCKWNGGGLALFESLLAALVAGELSAKFPHRIIELLEPYLLSRSDLYEMQPASDFDYDTIIGREFTHALGRQTSINGDERAELHTTLQSLLRDFLQSYQGSTGKSDDRIRDLVALCQTVAFAARTAPEPQPKSLI